MFWGELHFYFKMIFKNKYFILYLTINNMAEIEFKLIGIYTLL